MSRIPSPRPKRFVRVEWLGGTRETVISDWARLDVHTWAETEAATHDLCALVRGLPGVILESAAG